MFELIWWWILILLPLPFLIRGKETINSQQRALQLPQFDQAFTASKTSTTNHRRKWLWAAWIALLLACARPQWVGEPIPMPSQGRDLMLAIDLSRSMEIPDMVINGDNVDRFTMIQHILADFIERRDGDRLGMILFGDRAYLQAPLTMDKRTIVRFLNEAQIGLVGNQTAIGDAIALASKRFSEKADSNKVLVLLTDGSNTAGTIQPKQAIELAQQLDVVIYAIGVGADSLQQRGFFGSFNVPTSSDLDESLLKQMAQQTNGRYFRARSSEDLQAIYQTIDKLEPVEGEATSYRPRTELFYWPLLAALLCVYLPIFWQVISTLSAASYQRLNNVIGRVRNGR
ncbi:vWA domain-containing protein [Paraferrimonas haliotis]|uniref:VWR domain protein in aerotolerance operon BatA n=1 Tax=Paraferrimonas haliotis TaxID=2013866 RepID=A0AA37WWQ4_9GAMM|nr:VWA domain-containing protein [Paraferrimonas haliotis]GLS82624.1 VWR domain protein in aerotolerance operon BatA [Paraferrimonas haliotis]